MYYSQVPIKRVGWEKVRVGWIVYTFFLSLCRFLSVCYPTRTFSTLLVYLAPESMDHVRQNEVQVRNMVFFKANAFILPDIVHARKAAKVSYLLNL